MSRSTIEALLRGRLGRNGVLEPWDRQPCRPATVDDLDLPALRDALERMGAHARSRELEAYLRDGVQISAFAPSLCVIDPDDSAVRPRNYAMLLFGRDPRRFIAGAFSICAVAAGEGSDPTAHEQQEVAGTLLDQLRRLQELLQADAAKYPARALQELIVNALAHRDYTIAEPTRFTSYADRIEVVSPGPLPAGISLSDLRNNSVAPQWRNQGLAWFLNRMQLAQAEGQGIFAIKRDAKTIGSPPPLFNAGEDWVKCVLAASPRPREPADSRRGGRSRSPAKRPINARTKKKQTTKKRAASRSKN